MKFSEMKYVHLNIEETVAQIEKLTQRFREAKSFSECDAVFTEGERLKSRLETVTTLAYIRHTVDIYDEYYANEQSFIDENMPFLTDALQKMKREMLCSRFRGELEEKYGSLFFKNEEMSLKTFSPEIIGDLQEENRLTTEYEDILASAQIEFDGKICTVPQLSPYKQCPDDKMRLMAWTAEGNFFKSHKEELDTIYARLTELRTGMGKKLGYDDYIPLGYDRMMRNCYTRQDVATFRNAVVKYLVPLADSIYRAQAKRTGKAYPLNYADAALVFSDGNVEPDGTAEDILESGRNFYSAMSEETNEFINYLYDSELLDVLSKKGKANGGYCVSIPDYKAQFVFANFNGTADDVETVTHELGHAFADYTARNIFPGGLRSPTLEACEIHSMSMEFFAWDAAESFFGKKSDKFKYQHLAGALKFIPYGTMVDHFQHIVYENPSLTPSERDGEWRRLTKIYMPWIKLGDIPFYGDGCAWQRQHHIYSSPFYYIDYCLAQTVALEFWTVMQKDREKAWQAYMKLVRLGGTKTFTELVEAAGLENPFNEKALRDVCGGAAQWLDKFGEVF